MVVKSMVVGQAHASFPNRGGLHHYYANDKAAAGYRTGTFPDGAIVVDEAVLTKEGEGTATGLLLEGACFGVTVGSSRTRSRAASGSR